MLRKILPVAALSAFLLPTSTLLAQDAPAAEAPAAEAPLEPVLPQAHSEEASKMVDAAVDKMFAYGRGEFATTEIQDSALMRGAGIPFGAEDTEVDGGWHRNLVWGDFDGREFICGNGRTLAKVDNDWRLRRGKLSGGVKAPFTLDPDYLFTVVKSMPAAARRVMHVEPGKLRGRKVAILTMMFDGEDALEFSGSPKAAVAG